MKENEEQVCLARINGRSKSMGGGLGNLSSCLDGCAAVRLPLRGLLALRVNPWWQAGAEFESFLQEAVWWRRRWGLVEENTEGKQGK